MKITNPGLTALFDDMLSMTPLADLCRRAENGEITPGEIPLYTSLPYMAPELFNVIRNGGVKTDIYSLGVVLYTLLTSFNPFASSSPAKIMSNHLTLTPLRPDRLNPRIPAPLADLIEKCLKKEPAHRYASFADISLELRKIYTDMTGEAFEKAEIETETGEDYWINEGLGLKSINRNNEALEAFEEALAINPWSLRARFSMGSPPPGKVPGAPATGEKEWQLWFWRCTLG